eukprot:5914875-Amphidinium_carterae.1
MEAVGQLEPKEQERTENNTGTTTWSTYTTTKCNESASRSDPYSVYTCVCVSQGTVKEQHSMDKTIRVDDML